MVHHMSRRGVLAGSAALGASVGLVGLSAPGTANAGGAADRHTVALTDVTVIDATGARPRRDSTVIVRGQRILTVGPTRAVRVPPGATVIDATGKFLIPGLFEMHAHSSPMERTFLPLYLTNGVTTVQEMSAESTIAGWRQRIEAGTMLGPRWVIGSTIVDGSPSLWEGIGVPYISVRDGAEARAAVRAQKDAGADFIKVYTRLSREAFHAIADESRRLRIPFLGHVSDFVPVTEASDAGIRGIEHLFQMWYDMSSQEAALRRAVAEVPIGPGEYGAWFNRMHPVEYAAARSYDHRKAERVMRRLAHNRTRVTPTLSMHRVSDLPQDVARNDPRLRFFPAETQRIWSWSLEEIYLKGRLPEHVEQRRELFGRRLGLVRALADAGVPILAGTDTGTAYLMPGFSLHDELALLVQAGLSPMRALQAATLEPARMLGLQDSLGTIEAGKVADLVLLDADPLRDIRNTTRIDSVLVRGRLIGPQDRQRMLAEVLAAAGDPAPIMAPAGCACTRLPAVVG